MTFGSLFAGIGGLDLGLERAGMVCRWQIEKDEYCKRVLAKHWPGVKRYGDINQVSGAELEPVDLICGGFPCQDISDAGKRIGIIGERSGLWSEFARLVETLRPSTCLVENVAALRGRGLTLVLQDLWALGYDAEWNCIPAASVGAPHERDRIWIVAYSQGSGARIISERPRPERQRTSHVNGAGEISTNPYSSDEHWWDGDLQMGRVSITEGGAGILHGDGDQWSTEPGMGRVVHGVPNRLDRCKALGNAVVPQVAEWIGRRIITSTRTSHPKPGTQPPFNP